MGMFDDALKNAVPDGNLTKPLIIAAGALLLAKMFSHKSAPVQPESPPIAPQPVPVPQTADEVDTSDHGGLIGNLGGLLEKFQKGGQGDVINSWIGSGQNQTIQPGPLGQILGQSTISDLARKAGINEQDLLNQLAQALPGLINNLTPNGRLPTTQELGLGR